MIRRSCLAILPGLFGLVPADCNSPSDAVSESSAECGRHLFSGEDNSGVVSGVSGIVLFRFRGESSNIVFSSSKISIVSTLEDRRRPKLLRLEPPEVISRNACLEGPTLTFRLKDERGVKKRLNRLGVTVGNCLGRLVFSLPEAAGVGKA